MWASIFSVVLGLAGWLLASLFGKPLLNFFALRSQVHEEIIFTGNAGPRTAGGPEYNQAVEALRRLGARIQATDVSASLLLRMYLKAAKFDLKKAGQGLIGLSNSISTIDGSRALHMNSVQIGLKLPRDSTDEDIRLITAKISGRQHHSVLQSVANKTD